MIRLPKAAAPSLLPAVLLAGCTVGPRYVRPDISAPASLASANAPMAATPLSKVDDGDANLADWWSQFGDTELQRLIARARADNLDRATAASRVREARAVAAQARSALLPSVEGGADYLHARLSANAVPSGLASSLGGSAGGSGGGVSTIETDIYALGLQGSYTLDLFGANRSALRATRERADAEVWSARDTEVAVASEVARAYFDLRAGQVRLAVLRSNAGSQAALLDILAARASGGLVNEVDAARQRSQLAIAQAQVPPVEAQVASDIHQLGLLLGLAPDTLADELATPPDGGPDPLLALPAVPLHVPVGLPSTLLQRRPDIRVAERQLAASVSDVDRATAQLYPQIKLTGLGDLVSSSLKNLVDWGSRTLLAGASLAQPLFDGGGRLAQKRQAEERSVQASVAYRRTVLTAFGQTADALARYAADQRQVAVLRPGYLEARRAAELNRTQYLGGLSDLTATLQAETSALQTQDQLVQAHGAMLADLVGLYRALGGGWNPEEEPTQKSAVTTLASKEGRRDDQTR